MRLNLKYLMTLMMVYGFLLGMIFWSAKEKNIQMPVYNESAVEARVIDLRNIYKKNSLGQLLTRGFRLDFIQVSFEHQRNLYETVAPTNEIWESRSQSFLDLFKMIHKVKLYPRFDGLTKGDEILEYLKAYNSLGEAYVLPDHLDIYGLKYMGSFDVYLVDQELRYQKMMVCSLFESDNKDFRVVVTHDFDHTYHIIFDESRNSVVNYMYQNNMGTLVAMGFNKSIRLEEKVYLSLLEMIVSDKNRLQIHYNTDQLVILRQVKELR